jgi:hypothetical protein
MKRVAARDFCMLAEWIVGDKFKSLSRLGVEADIPDDIVRSRFRALFPPVDFGVGFTWGQHSFDLLFFHPFLTPVVDPETIGECVLELLRGLPAALPDVTDGGIATNR